MSDTPRTDAKRSGPEHFMGDWVDANFACQLERELNAANSEIEEKRKDVVWLATEKAKLENYVMLLEEAGDALKAAGYFGGWADAVNKWIKAKEDKP